MNSASCRSGLKSGSSRDHVAEVGVDLERLRQISQRERAVPRQAPIAGQVVVQHGLAGVDFHGPLQHLDRLGQLAGPLVAPAQRQAARGCRRAADRRCAPAATGPLRSGPARGALRPTGSRPCRCRGPATRAVAARGGRAPACRARCSPRLLRSPGPKECGCAPMRSRAGPATTRRWSSPIRSRWRRARWRRWRRTCGREASSSPTPARAATTTRRSACRARWQAACVELFAEHKELNTLRPGATYTLAGAEEFAGHQASASAYLQFFTLRSARAALTYRGEVAACVNRYGKGTAYLAGTLLGRPVAERDDAGNQKLIAAMLQSAGVPPEKIGKLHRKRRVLGGKRPGSCSTAPARRWRRRFPCRDSASSTCAPRSPHP